MSDDRIDHLIAALERLTQGAPARRFYVRFGGFGASPPASTVVEAWSHDDAVKAASIRLRRKGHDPDLVRPALDTDCLACGGEHVIEQDYCRGCQRNREQQVAIMRGGECW